MLLIRKLLPRRCQRRRRLSQQSRRPSKTLKDLWEIKDKLREHVSTAELQEMLTANNQDATSSEYDLRERWLVYFTPRCCFSLNFFGKRFVIAPRALLSTLGVTSANPDDIKRTLLAQVCPLLSFACYSVSFLEIRFSGEFIVSMVRVWHESC